MKTYIIRYKDATYTVEAENFNEFGGKAFALIGPVPLVAWDEETNTFTFADHVEDDDEF